MSIFLALDTIDPEVARRSVLPLRPYLGGIKIGLELFLAHGKQGYRRLESCGLPIFLDLKLHDIPNTVEGAIRAISDLSPHYLTLHAAGGADMMRRAVDAVQKYCPTTKLLGVTVLTSMDKGNLRETGVQDTPGSQVLKLAHLGKLCGLDGVICSPKEVKILRDSLGSSFHLVVPGIRSKGSMTSDQKRTLSPFEAMKAGATALVIGRPILASKDPVAAVKLINQEIESAL